MSTDPVTRPDGETDYICRIPAELDDRPRRGPQPPKEQLDLLDPRNTPSRERTRV